MSFGVDKILSELAKNIHENALEKKFWDTDGYDDFELRRQFISMEFAELGDCIRNGSSSIRCDKDINLSAYEEEIADICIWAMDYLYKSNPSIIIKEMGNTLFDCKIDDGCCSKLTVLAHIQMRMWRGMKPEPTLLELISSMYHYHEKYKGNGDKEWLDIIRLKHEYNITREERHGKKI